MLYFQRSISVNILFWAYAMKYMYVYAWRPYTAIIDHYLWFQHIPATFLFHIRCTVCPLFVNNPLHVQSLYTHFCPVCWVTETSGAITVEFFSLLPSLLLSQRTTAADLISKSCKEVIYSINCIHQMSSFCFSLYFYLPCDFLAHLLIRGNGVCRYIHTFFQHN